MRKILFLSFLIVSFASYGQVKQAYNQYGGIWNRLALRYNGGFQLPRTTLSVKDLNVATPDSGQVYYNSTDSSIYLNAGTGSPWIKVGGATYTANLPIRVTGTVISADTSVAYSPSLTTNARLKKIMDSLSAAGYFNQKFGHASGDFRAAETRNFSGAGAWTFNLDSLYSMYIAVKRGQFFQVADYETGNDRLFLGDEYSSMASPGQTSSITIYDDTISVDLASTSSKLLIPNIPYNSGSEIVGLGIDTLTNRVFRKSGGGGTINSGTTGKPAYYVGATTLDDFAAVDYATSGTNMLLTTQNTTDVGLNIKAQSSQSANLQNWSSSAGTGDLGSMTKDGYFRAVRLGTTSSTPSFPLDIIGGVGGVVARFRAVTGGADFQIEAGDAGPARTDYRVFSASRWIYGAYDRTGGSNIDFELYNSQLSAFAAIFDGNTNYYGIGEDVVVDRRLHITDNDAVTNAVTYINRLTHVTSGTAAAGFGGGTEYELENASGTNRVAGAKEIVYTDATNATEDADYIFKTIKAGTLTEQARFISEGALRLGEVAAPSTPASATALIYAKSDGLWYGKDDAGLETKLSNDAAATPTLQQVLTAGATLTGDNTIVNDANTLTITGNTVAGDPILSITSTSTAAASSLQKGLNIALSGANATSTQTTYGIYSLNTHTGTSSTNIGLYSESSGGTTNYGLRSVTGSGSNDIAVLGESSGGATSIYGQNTSTGYAVYGYNGGGGGYGTYGVTATGTGAFGSATGTNGMGVQAVHATANDGIAIYANAFGASTTKIAGQFKATGATNNYAIIVASGEGNVGLGTSTPSAQALLELVSTNQALLIMRMTATQASAITAADGMMLYVTDTNGTFTSVGFWGRENGAWVKL